MNSTLTLNYVQRIEKHLVMLYYISIQMLCLPSVSHIRYLFICSEADPGVLRHVADALRKSPWRHAKKRN